MFRKGFLTKAAAWLTVLVLVMGMIPSQVFAGSPVLTVRCSVPEAGLSYTASSGTYQDLVPDENGTLSVELTDGLVDIAITDLKGSGEGYVFKGWKIYVSDVQYGPVTEADSASLKVALSSAVVFADGTDVFVSADGSLGFYGTVQSGITFEAVFESQEVTSPQESDPVIDETQESSGPMRGDPEAWDGETVSEPSVIDGVYQISSAAELAWFASKVNDGTGVNYDATLTRDIDLNNKQWTPIGSFSVPYKGCFDGNGFTIINFCIEIESIPSGAGCVGMFGHIDSATIENLTARGFITIHNCKGNNLYIAGIVGWSQGASTVKNCSSNVAIIVTEGSSPVYAGGIVGYNQRGGCIIACTNYGSINVDSAMTNSRSMILVGGICGMLDQTSFLEFCRNFGNINGITKKFGNAIVGGVVGYAVANSRTNGCYNCGTVTGSHINTSARHFTGAIAGNIAGTNTVTNCFYLEGSCGSGGGNAVDTEGVLVAKTNDYMKSEGFVIEINSIPPVSDYECQWEFDVTGYPAVTYLLLNNGIKSFTVDGQNAAIDREKMRITLTIPFDSGVELTLISPVVEIGRASCRERV